MISNESILYVLRLPSSSGMGLGMYLCDFWGGRNFLLGVEGVGREPREGAREVIGPLSEVTGKEGDGLCSRGCCNVDKDWCCRRPW